MKNAVKNIIAKAKKSNRYVRSFNVDKSVYEEFVKKCEKNHVSMSRVIEELIKEFLSKK